MSIGTEEVLKRNVMPEYGTELDDEGISRLIAGLAHHINTPLGNIVMSASYLLDSLEGQEISEITLKQCLEIILKSAGKISGIMNELKNMVVEDPGPASQAVADIKKLEQVLRKQTYGDLKIRHQDNFALSCARKSLFPALVKIFSFLKSRNIPGEEIILRASRQQDVISIIITLCSKELDPRIYDSFFTPFAKDCPGSAERFGLYTAGMLIRENLKGAISIAMDGESAIITISFPS